MTATVKLASTDRRNDARVEVERRAVLRAGDRAIDVEIEDLTRDGCRIRTSAVLEPFTPVSIGLAGVGHTPARLVWRSESAYGCAFERPLPAGAVTTAALSNVAYLGDVSQGYAAGNVVKYSYRTRVAIIAGSSAALWGMIIAGAAMLF